MQRRICLILSIILLFIAISMFMMVSGVFDRLVALAIFLWAGLTAYCVWDDKED